MIKKTIAALALSLSAGAAMAETGIINFHGTVSTGGTCPIDVVTPGGPALPRVHLGDFRTKDFTAVGQKTPAVHFGLRVTPDATCVIDPAKKAYVTFSPRFGADPSGKLYSLQSGLGYTTGMVMEIKDRKNALVEPGKESAPFDLSATAPTDMSFIAALQTTAATVTEGQIETSVDFLVDIR